ncbi:MAG: hydrolase [Patescibacteria group bacterium]
MTNETNCCPKFNPEPWDKKTFNWENKKFIKAKVFTLFFMPINFGSVITKLMKQVETAGGKATDYLCLSDHVSKWSMDIYLAVDKEIPGAENVTLNGKYISKVYEGNFKDTGIWCKDFEQYVKDQNLSLKKMYMWYTTCPKCAKHYGKNYTVLVAEV